MPRIRGLGLRTIVVRNARVRHYGWVGLSPGIAMVRATASHGVGRTRQMVVSRVRFHFAILPARRNVVPLQCFFLSGAW